MPKMKTHSGAKTTKRKRNLRQNGIMRETEEFSVKRMLVEA